MSNVLPKERLRLEWKRFRNRVLLVGALVFLGTAVFSALTLIPAHLALYSQNDDTVRTSAEESKTLPGAKTTSKSEFEDVMRSQALLDTVRPIISSTSSPTALIKMALSYRPSGISVDHITFVSGNIVTINGASQGRENINQYKEALFESGLFKSVSVPVGALVGVEEGKFTITLSGKL